MYGRFIEAAAKRQGIDASELARRVGYKDADMIRKIYRDVSPPSFKKFEQIAAALEVPIGDLLPNSGANPASDRLEPIMAALFGLPDGTQNELLANLAVQARTLAAWRRRDSEAPRPEKTKALRRTDEVNEIGSGITTKT